MKLINVSIIAITVLLLIGCSANQNDKTKDSVKDNRLPFIGEMEFDYDENNQITDTIYHTIPNFEFLAHDSSLITSETVKGKIYVADFFFTSCPSICPKMTNHMQDLHNRTKDIEGLMFLSHTVDPERDSLPVLNEYIKTMQIETGDNWFFLWAPQGYTYEIGKYGYLINADVDPKAEGGFLHSEHFVLIDKERRIRGMYEGTDKSKIDQLEKDIRKLVNEYE
ncbi:MAG TPA: SCO family protein [Crocinitomix sp.]|nr:SCO family protein [Crocinitomix sp.]